MVEWPLENGRCALRTEDLTAEYGPPTRESPPMILTPLDATLTKGAFVTPLSSTLTRPSRKNIKTRDFNSISCHTYEGALHKFFRCHTYKKGVGGGERFLRGPICSARAFLASPDSIGRSGRGLCPGPNAGHGSRITAAMDPLRHQPPLLPLSRPIATHQPTLRDDGSRNDMIFRPPSCRATEVQK